MDLRLTDDQRAITDLAASVFGGEVTAERLARAEASTTTIDTELLATLAGTGLLGIGLPEDHGGTGGGTVELCCVLEQQGRAVAPVPLAHSLSAAAVLARHADSALAERWVPAVIEGSAVLTAALDVAVRPSPLAVRRAPDGWVVDGVAFTVPAAPAASALLAAARVDGGAGERLFLVELGSDSVAVEAVRTTNRLAHGHITFTGAAATPVGDGPEALHRLRATLRVALAAVALGVAEEALARAAVYTSQRHQFGQPLSSFQSTAHRAADGYIDVEAMRGTLWQATWLLDQAADPAAEAAALVAAWWAADGGARVVQSVQHLHGGLGADTDYPIHRYFLWGSQLATDLGGASALLSQLGAAIASASLVETS
jgi:alkylation response protein AidB-like acyl-CoA dehydrogenase